MTSQHACCDFVSEYETLAQTIDNRKQAFKDLMTTITDEGLSLQQNLQAAEQECVGELLQSRSVLVSCCRAGVCW